MRRPQFVVEDATTRDCITVDLRRAIDSQRPGVRRAILVSGKRQPARDAASIALGAQHRRERCCAAECLSPGYLHTESSSRAPLAEFLSSGRWLTAIQFFRVWNRRFTRNGNLPSMG